MMSSLKKTEWSGILVGLDGDRYQMAINISQRKNVQRNTSTQPTAKNPNVLVVKKDDISIKSLWWYYGKSNEVARMNNLS